MSSIIGGNKQELGSLMFLVELFQKNDNKDDISKTY